MSEEQHPPQADSYAVATLNRFLILQDKATEPAALETISSAVAPEVHHVSHLLPLSRPTVFWTMTHQLTLSFRENQFLTHLPHTCSNHRPRGVVATVGGRHAHSIRLIYLHLILQTVSAVLGYLLHLQARLVLRDVLARPLFPMCLNFLVRISLLSLSRLLSIYRPLLFSFCLRARHISPWV